jgi:polyphosphate kinase
MNSCAHYSSPAGCRIDKPGLPIFTVQPSPLHNDDLCSFPVISMTDSLPSLDSPSLYINRELSWIRFNHHVLEEARDERHPLLERVKFLAIYANNLDEFFMIRVSGLQRQAAQGMLKAPPDGMTASEQILAIEKALIPDLDLSFECWNSEILPRLASRRYFHPPVW